MATTLTYTVRDLCTEALREAGVVGIDRPADADEMRVAVLRLNMMLKGWQNQIVTVWKQSTGSISITANTRSYTITSRPMSLDVVNYKSGTETPMMRMERREYFELPDKDSAGTPSQFYYQRGREQGVLYVWPVLVSATGTIEWSGRLEVEDITGPSDAVDFPAEWYEAVLYGLALRLSSAFGTNSPLLPMMAKTTYDTAAAGDVDGSLILAAER